MRDDTKVDGRVTMAGEFCGLAVGGSMVSEGD